MINLKTNCKDCLHNKVCKRADYPQRAYEKLASLREPIIDDDFYGVNIDISCPDYAKLINYREVKIND